MGLTAETLLHGYSIGVFPMAEHRDDPDVFWVDPRRRGILPLDDFHISRSLARRIRKESFRLTRNHDFEGVLQGCADRSETWINRKIHDLYATLHRRGQAHSIEVWDNARLVGGVYGVVLGSAFFGESMFSHQTDASKVALAYLVTHLRLSGFTLFDTQFLTEHLASLGGVEIPRSLYHNKLADALQRKADITIRPLPSSQDVLQRKTQTS